MTDEEKPVKRRGGRVVKFPTDYEPPAREHAVPPPGLHNSKTDPRPNTPPAPSGLPGMGKRWTELHRRVEVDKEITWEEVVAEMDSEELARRQFRSKNGIFEGRPPGRVPMAFVRACDAELVSRGAVQWKSAYNAAISTLVEIAENGEKDSDRVKAAAMIIERIEGKVADKVVVTGPAGGQTVDEILLGVLAEVNAETAEAEAIARAHDYTSRMGARDDD